MTLTNNVCFALLLAWPLYNLALVTYSHRSHTNDGFHGRNARPRTRHQPQTFWIVVPCLNEERVIGRTVAAALELSPPPGAQAKVLVVDDGSDDGTAEVLDAIEDPDLHVLRRVAPDARQGKGEALNAAYRAIRGWAIEHDQDPQQVVVGVIDGDGRGSANILGVVSRALRDAEVGAVQCRVRIHNRGGLLGAVQDLEFGSVADASQLLRNTVGTVGLGGNGQFTRLSALQKLGESPWSKCLVEDLELGLRLHLAGTRIRYVASACVTQQGLVSLRRLARQRTRWAQGNLQCVSYVPKLIASRRIPNHALVEMLYYLLAPWVNAIGTVAMLGLWGFATARLLPGNTPTFIAADWQQLGQITLAWLAALIAPNLIWAVLHRFQLRDQKLGRCALAALAYPAFLFLNLISTWRAMFRQIGGRRAWAKTERLPEDQAAVAVPGASPASSATPA